MNFRILNKALHNNGYRYVGKKEGIHVYGKPIGYGCLYAYVCEVNAGANLEIKRIVKEKQQQKTNNNNKTEESMRQNWSFEKINKINKPLSKSTRRHKDKIDLSH